MVDFVPTTTRMTTLMQRIKLQVRFALVEEAGVGGWNHCGLRNIRTKRCNSGGVISKSDFTYSIALRCQNLSRADSVP